MKPLSESFTKNGFHHEQIARAGMVAIYRRHKPSIKSEPHFEVIRIQSHNGFEVGGVKLPPSETYPSSTSWGTYGFTYRDKEDAWKRFESLLYPTQ